MHMCKTRGEHMDGPWVEIILGDGARKGRGKGGWNGNFECCCRRAEKGRVEGGIRVSVDNLG